MAVGVVHPHRRDRDPRLHRLEERRQLVPAAVVRNLQHVGPQVPPGGQEVRLRLRFDVAGEQQHQPGDLDTQDQGAVVGVGVRADVGPQRCEQLPAQPPESTDLAKRGTFDCHASCGGLPSYVVDLASRLVQRADLDRTHRATQHPREAVDVVGMQVGEQQHRDGADAEPTQAAVDRAGIGACVDHDCLPGTRPQRERVPLPDVTDAEDPVRGRPSGTGDPHPDQRQHRAREASRQRPPRCAPGESRDHDKADRGQQHGAGRAPGPAEMGTRDRRADARDLDQPGGGQVGEPGQRLGQGQAERRHQGGGDSGQGRRGDRGDGEQVGRDRQRAEVPRDRHDDGTTEDLCGSGYGEGCGQPQRQVPVQGARPGRREHEQPRGGQDRQRETRGGGEPRVDKHESQDGSRQGREGAAAAPGQQANQPDQTHGGSAQDAG